MLEDEHAARRQQGARAVHHTVYRFVVRRIEQDESNESCACVKIVDRAGNACADDNTATRQNAVREVLRDQLLRAPIALDERDPMRRRRLIASMPSAPVPA
jgi:hypothetical protein